MGHGGVREQALHIPLGDGRQVAKRHRRHAHDQQRDLQLLWVSTERRENPDQHADRGDLGYDPAALRAKYAAERDKRIRADGNEQYIDIASDFSSMIEDPYVEPDFTREPCTDEVDVLLIGGGFGSLQTGARLREQGVEDIMVVERAGDFGGTWYWNRYPGAHCDVESYVYMPLLEELDYMPRKKYAPAAEILAHSQAIARHYNLYEKALFQTDVTELRWDGDSLRWIVSTSRGDRIRARFVAMSNGLLDRPKLPGIPGLRDFKGHTFHTCRWDYDYTGGTPDGQLDGLRDKRVAVIGTGATSVQCIPHLGESAEHLYVFQRTPSSIDVRDNRDTDPEWVASLEPGWQKHRVQNFHDLVTGTPRDEDLVNDGWTDLVSRIIEHYKRGARAGASAQDIMEVLELANFEKMNEIRARADALVDDPKTAESLKPYYNMLCKRPCFHDTYLQTFNRPNVTLVDTDGKGVERITETGLVVDGNEYEVDCIVYATGFHVTFGYSDRAGYQVHGRKGRTMSQKFQDEGTRTFHGMFSREFPNCFIVGAVQGGFTVNYPLLLEQVGVHLAHVVGHALRSGIETVECSAEAEESWVQTIVGQSGPGSSLGSSECTPGYYNNEGKASDHAGQDAPYGGLVGGTHFWNLLDAWRKEGSFAGLEFDAIGASVDPDDAK